MLKKPHQDEEATVIPPLIISEEKMRVFQNLQDQLDDGTQFPPLIVNLSVPDMKGMVEGIFGRQRFFLREKKTNIV